MVISIDHSASEPIYQQIRSEVVAAIARGELQPGDRLPSVRALASDLGVNLHTVNKAYAILRDEGHLTMNGRNGARVADFPANASAATHEIGEARLAESLYLLAIEHRARGGSAQGFLDIARKQAERAYSDDPPVSRPAPIG